MIASRYIKCNQQFGGGTKISLEWLWGMDASNIKGCCNSIKVANKTGSFVQSINSLLPCNFLPKSFSISKASGTSSSLNTWLNNAEPICLMGSTCTDKIMINKILMNLFAIVANIYFHETTCRDDFCLTKK